MDLVEEQLRNSKTIAVVGLSDNPERISYGVDRKSVV
jgi:predicted CoA-binding protein